MGDLLSEISSEDTFLSFYNDIISKTLLFDLIAFVITEYSAISISLFLKEGAEV